MSMLELRGVSKVYGLGATEVHALHDISLEVTPGTMVAVMVRVAIVRVMTHPVVVRPVAVTVVVTVAVPADVDLHAHRHHVRLLINRLRVHGRILREGAACAEQCAASDQRGDDRTRSLLDGIHGYSPFRVSLRAMAGSTGTAMRFAVRLRPTLAARTFHRREDL